MVRTIYQQLSPAEVHGQLDRVVEQLREPFAQVAELLADATPDILAFTAFPVAHWQKLWSNNPQERLNREIRRRTNVVGLAPWSRGSGKKRGHRAIRGGRGLVRRALYMCAWAVIRHDSEMRRFYDRLRQRGKPGNVAVVAVMRKILLQINAVARRGTPWVPQEA